MALRRVLLAAVFIAFSQEPSFAACTDAAIAATRAAADQACAAMGIGCTTAKSHGAYVSCVAHQAKAAAKAGTLPKDCKGAVVRCAARSTCGKPGAVACCRTDRHGKTSCAIKKSASRCTKPKGGTACAGVVSSCCDACAGQQCAAGTTTTTTVTTTSLVAGSTSTTLACGTFVTMWGMQGSGDGEFQQPGWVATDGAGHVYVTDRFNNRVQKFDEVGTFITTWGTPGSGDGQFSGPAGIAVGPGGG